MKKSIILYFAAVIGMGSQLHVHAQDRRLELDLQTAIDIALNDNPTIKVADLEIERQRYVRKETAGNLFPSVGVDGSYTRAIKKSELGSGLSFDPDNTVSFSANVGLPLFAPSIYKTLKLNDDQIRAAVEDARASRVILISEVRKSFYNILLAQQSLEVLRNSLTNTSQTVEETRVRFNSGLASEYDLITAEVQLSNLRPTIIQTENSIDISKKILKMYLNLPLEIDIAVKGNLNEYVDQIDDDSNMYHFTDLESNTDLRAADIQIEILQRQLELQRTMRMPTLSAFGVSTVSGRDPISLSFGGSDDDVTSSESSKFLWMYPISVGVRMSIPIFTGNSRINRERQIRNYISQAQAQRSYLENSINVELNSAVNNLITARETMRANRATVAQAQKGYDISKTRFNAGMGTILEVNTAELSLTQSKLNFTQSIYDYLSAQADYERIRGEEK